VGIDHLVADVVQAQPPLALKPLIREESRHALMRRPQEPSVAETA
jgi:hypothetical protein